MRQELRQQQGLRVEQHVIPRLTARLLTLNSQQLRVELGTLVEQNPLLEIPERSLPHMAPSVPTLAEHLGVQLGQTPMADRVRADALLCVTAIDQRGFLPATDKLASATGLSKVRARAAAKAIRRLDPPGVGANDLADCMLLQLDASEADPKTVRIARNLVRNHFAALSRRRLDLLPAKNLPAAMELITGLQPRFADDFVPAAAAIEPELEAYRDQGLWRVRPCGDGFARVDEAMVAQAAGDRSLRKLLREARQLTDSLAFRQATLLKVAQAIVDRQRAFFERGTQALVPLRLREIAAATGLALSTVAATAQGKYIVSPQRTVALKYLLQRATEKKHGRDGRAAAALQEAIKQLISNEDPTAPLTDIRILQQLRKRGDAIARRTVAKHRMAAGIPAAHLRRALRAQR